MKNIFFTLFILIALCHPLFSRIGTSNDQFVCKRIDCRIDIHNMRDSLQAIERSMNGLPDSLQYEYKCHYFRRWATDTLSLLNGHCELSDDSLELEITDTLLFHVRHNRPSGAVHVGMAEDILNLLQSYKEIHSSDFKLICLISHSYRPTLLPDLYERKDNLLQCKTIDSKWIRTFEINDVGYILYSCEFDRRKKIFSHYEFSRINDKVVKRKVKR